MTFESGDRLERDEFVAGYLAEADEHLQASIKHLLAVEGALKNNEPHHRVVRELFRSLHTLKGLSAMVGAEPVVDLAHEMESVLREKHKSGARLSVPLVDLLLRGVRAIEERVSAFGARKPLPPAPSALLEAFAAFHGEPGARGDGGLDALTLDADLKGKLAPSEAGELVDGVARGRRAFHIDFVPSAERAAQGVSITSVRGRVAALGDIVKVVPRTRSGGAGLTFALIVLTDRDAAALADACYAVAEEAHPIVSRPSTEEDGGAAAARLEGDGDGDDDDASDGRDGAPRASTIIRVDVRRLDDALEKLSGLIVTRFRLARATAELRARGVDVSELSAIVGDAARQLVGLRDSITRARMVSVAEMLERVPLIVRGMSRTTGKSVRLEVNAGDAELDKAVAEKIFPAIVHLVRNAVDHAIEPAEERRRLGKPEEGVITVACFEHSDSQLELTITDDGRGIDAAAVCARAGVPVPASADALLDVITRPGLSTAAVATTTSGRGIGMDIVKRIAVDVLGGELHLRTAPGLGTTFTLTIPLSISILDSFSFVCAADTFVVPVAAVEEIVDVAAAEIVKPPSERGGATATAAALMRRRSDLVPLFDLAALLAQNDDRRPASAPPPPAHHGERDKALVVRRQGQLLAFRVSRVLGKQEVVVRPLEDPLVKRPGVAGTTDLGDGKPTLVLDLGGLIRREATA